MNCPDCGKEIKPGAVFCSGCGGSAQTPEGAILAEYSRVAASPAMVADHYFTEYYLDNEGNIREVNRIVYNASDDMDAWETEFAQLNIEYLCSRRLGL